MLSKMSEYMLFTVGILIVILFGQQQMNRLIHRKLKVSIFYIAQRSTMLFYVFVFLLLATGIWYVNGLEHQERQKYERNLSRLAASFAAELSQMNHQQVTDTTNANDKTYLGLLRTLNRWQHDHPNIRQIYTLKQRADGQNYVMLSVKADDGKHDGQQVQDLPSGAAYQAHMSELAQAFQGKISIKNEGDLPKNFVIFCPILTQQGKVDAVLIIRYDGAHYMKKMHHQLHKGMGRIFLLFFISYIFYLLLLYVRLDKLSFKKYSEEVQRIQHRLKRLSEISMEGIIIYSGQTILEVNHAACRLFGYTENELMRTPMEALVASPPLPDWTQSLVEDTTYEVHLRKKDGTTFPAEVLKRKYDDYSRSRMVDVVAVRDITERKKHEDRMNYIAFYDDLTGLPNKEMLYQMLSEKLTDAQNLKRKTAVMFMEVKGIKAVNDLYGYTVGDQVLLASVAKIKNLVGETDIFGRWGGNEFIVILPQVDRDEQVSELCQRLIEAMEEPLIVNEQEFRLTLKIGISCYPKDGDNGHTLIRRADIARHELSKQAIGQFRFFEKQMNRTIYEKIHMERELRKALEAEEFELHYQPQIQLQTGKVIGIEALIRWKHREKGMISPNAFIPIAEETGFIISINEWVMETACRQTKLLLHQYPSLSVSINLSPCEFESRKLIYKLAKILEKTDFPPHCLDIEITERMTMDTEKAIPILKELKNVGVNVSIDDFGTGYSSLSYLKKLPIDRLKIDRSFVQNVQKEEEAILPAIITLGHNIGVKVLAEGVETELEAAYLKEKQCDEVQGYYYTRPLPYGELVQFLDQHKQQASAIIS
ncbi:diguanylate cyclase domain protein [Anoxybacillus sp. B7M1]|uniref:putative bifunctional diguanylate cyclase/phosphodiesterase n=1 Tax=Anoxybacillaceae TaxID=3120669 RepID=UPI0005CDB78D|nr:MULTISPECIES: bifunctional diguanylate cyclase/phosphodiesterase [Anoxybacillus]ANB64124.1 diguanylate cyclase domain protein [Anoxybacillus sp. B7M1]